MENSYPQSGYSKSPIDTGCLLSVGEIKMLGGSLDCREFSRLCPSAHRMRLLGLASEEDDLFNLGQPRILAWGAKDHEGTPVGLLVAEARLEREDNGKTCRVIEILSIYVKQERRRQRIATELIRLVTEKNKRLWVARIEISVPSEDERQSYIEAILKRSPGWEVSGETIFASLSNRTLIEPLYKRLCKVGQAQKEKSDWVIRELADTDWECIEKIRITEGGPAWSSPYAVSGPISAKYSRVVISKGLICAWLLCGEAHKGSLSYYAGWVKNGYEQKNCLVSMIADVASAAHFAVDTAGVTDAMHPMGKIFFEVSRSNEAMLKLSKKHFFSIAGTRIGVKRYALANACD